MSLNDVLLILTVVIGLGSIIGPILYYSSRR